MGDAARPMVAVWSAAELLPDDSDALAKKLIEAGGWMKAKDPKPADRFYKALVKRCANNSWGRLAAEQHWFPAIRPATEPTTQPH